MSARTPAPKPVFAYSRQEAARALGISLSLLDQKIEAGEITPRFINSKKVILATELQAYADSLPHERATG